MAIVQPTGVPGEFDADGNPLALRTPARFVREAALYLPQSARVLDVGSHIGRSAMHLAELGHEVVGLELDERYIEDKRKLARFVGGAAVSHTLDVQGDLNALPFRANSFDAVVSTISLQYIEPGRDRGEALRDIQRVTRPGGLNALQTYIATGAQAPKLNHNLFRPGEVLATYQRAGWQIVRHEEEVLPLSYEPDRTGQIKPHFSSNSRLLARKPSYREQHNASVRSRAEHLRRMHPHLADQLLAQVE